MKYSEALSAAKGLKRAWGVEAAVLSITQLCSLAAWAQPPFAGCPTASGATAQIEALPAPPQGLTLSGDTCKLRNTVTSYEGCRISGNNYPNPEAIYMVSLHEGNKVEFTLNVLSGDLALALIQPCRDDACLRSSDGIGIAPSRESLFAFQYKPGIYYLSVDAREGASCGKYTLTVTGTNPVPDLVVGLNSPKTVTAGRTLTYTLSVRNDPKLGRLPATGVMLTQTLPDGITILSTDGCTKVNAKTLICNKDNKDEKLRNLAVGSKVDKTIKIRVNSGTTGGPNHILSSTLTATANEGDQSPKDNQVNLDTFVKMEIALSIRTSISPTVAIAGNLLTYTFHVHNAGPSDATSVAVKDVLPAGVDFVSADQGCQRVRRTVTCTIPRISPPDSAHDGNADRSITVKVNPAAGDGSQLVNTASMTAAETGSVSISDTATTRVVRNSDLSITKKGPENPAEVTAGEKLTYELAICNCGPSNSSGATITDDLPPGLHFFGSLDRCISGNGSKVTCQTDPIAVGGCRPDKRCDLSAANQRLHFVVDVPSCQPEMTLRNTASIKAVETDPNSANNTSLPAETAVKIKADLSAVKTARGTLDFAETDSAVAGDNLAYLVEVKNDGPSDSPGGTIRDELASGLVFVASPDDQCQESKEGLKRVVSCPVPALPAKQSYFARFVVAVPLDAPGTLTNDASVKGETDVNPTNDKSASVFTTVKQKADLSLTVSGSPDPLDLSKGQDLFYTVDVTNAGPSNALSLVVRLNLPDRGSFVSAPVPSCSESGGLVECTLDALAAHEHKVLEIHTLAPGLRGSAKATASVSSATADPDLANNTAMATTTLADADDADLVVTKTAGVEAVVAGDLIPYTIEVVNRGPADTTDVKLLDAQPKDTIFESVSTPDCTISAVGVSCAFPMLKSGASMPINLTAKVNADSAEPLVANTAKNPSPSSDPNPDNNRDTVETPVLHVAPLVLPFFEVASDQGGATTLLSVTNPSDTLVGVRYDYFLEDGGTEREDLCLEGNQTLTKDLSHVKDVPAPLQGRSGYVGITPVDLAACPLSEPPPILAGNFTRIDRSGGPAAVFPLVATDTSRVPPELCRHWRIPFFNSHTGSTLVDSTEFFFFVPGDHPSGPPVAVGKVYGKDGKFVQEILVSDPKEAFRRTSQVGFDNPVQGRPPVPLLASGGTIEWEFPNGVGTVSAIHRTNGGSNEPVLGICHPPESLSRGDRD